MSLIDDQKLLEKGHTEAKQKKLDDSKLKAEEIRVAACTTIKRSGNANLICIGVLYCSNELCWIVGDIFNLDY